MTSVPEGYSNNAISYNDVANGVLTAYKDILEKTRNCLGVWVIIGSTDAPHANGDGEVHLNYGDVVFWDDSGWFVCADGLIIGTAQLARNGNWHRVSQWTVYSEFHRGMVTLIDRSK